MLKNSKSGRFLHAALLTLTCGGCAQLPAAVVSRDLPARPSFMAPVALPVYRLRDDPRLDLKKTADRLDEANGRLVQSRGWYESVRETYRTK